MKFADKLEGKGHAREWVATQVAEQRQKLVQAAQGALTVPEAAPATKATEDKTSSSKPVTPAPAHMGLTRCEAHARAAHGRTRAHTHT